MGTPAAMRHRGHRGSLDREVSLRETISGISHSRVTHPPDAFEVHFDKLEVRVRVYQLLVGHPPWSKETDNRHTKL